MENSFTYIIVDGIDGVGKTTQISRMASEFESRGMRVVQVREPGGTDIGSQIRSILLSKDTENISPAAELLLFFADRAQLHYEVLRREMEFARSSGKKTVVISDRGIPSTYAYQYHHNRFDARLVLALEELSGMVTPSMVILLDLDESVALERAVARLEQQDNNMMHSEGRFEAKGLEYYKSIRQGFHNYLQANRERVDIRMVDASGSSDQVFAKIVGELDNMPT